MISGLSLDDEAAKIQQLRQLLETATPGPWTVETGMWGDANIGGPDGAVVAHDRYGCIDAPADAALIAAARNALPWLLDRLVEAEQREQRLRALCRDWTMHPTSGVRSDALAALVVRVLDGDDQP